MNQDKYQLFVDLDGVLADFETGVLHVTGKKPGELHPSRMWPILARTPDFYRNLGWMADGHELWNHVKHLAPVILTGIPRGKWAEPQKRSWCWQELGPDVPVITCMTRKKTEMAREWMEQNLPVSRIPVLIDDRLKTADPWDSGGGHFILHISMEQSLRELHALGD